MVTREDHTKVHVNNNHTQTSPVDSLNPSKTV